MCKHYITGMQAVRSAVHLLRCRLSLFAQTGSGATPVCAQSEWYLRLTEIPIG